MFKLLINIFVALTFLAMPAVAENTDGIIVKFAQVSDSHLSYTRTDNSRRLFKDSDFLLKEVISKINKVNNVNFVIFTGDMVDSPYGKALEQFVLIADQLKMPWYPVLGNHDVAVKAGSKKNLVKFFMANSKGMQKEKPYYTFYPKNNVAVIVLDATTDEKNTVAGHIGNQQLLWLNNELKKNTDKTVIISIHHPIEPPFKGSNHEIVEPDKTNLLNLLYKYKNIALVISGHYHTTKIFKKNGIVFACAPSLIEYPNAFRLITIKNNGEINFDWYETSRKDLLTKSKNLSKWHATSYGSPQDRVNTVKYK